jgi:hypothetical protein
MNKENKTDKDGIASSNPSAALFEAFEVALNLKPHLLLEVGYNRVTGWMVHVYDAADVGIENAKKVFCVQQESRIAAMKEAVGLLREIPSGIRKCEVWECEACGKGAPCRASITYQPTPYPHVESCERFAKKPCLCGITGTSPEWKKLGNTLENIKKGETKT